MLSSMYFLWDTEYPLYVYVCIFIIILIIWQVQQNYHGLKFEHKRSCCQRHQKVRQRARDAASRARRLCREEAEKPRELLSIMKSQSWLPKKESVRQLLCIDPCCQICNTAALEIQQLLESEKSQISSALLGLSQGSSCLEMLSTSSASFEQNMELYSRHPTDFSVVPVTATLPQPTGHLTQSTNAVNVQEHWDDHLQLGPELSDIPVVSETMVSSRPEEPAVLVNEEIIHSNLNFVQEDRNQQSLNSQVPFQTLNPESSHFTHPMTLSIVSTSHQPFLSPEVLRFLELHVKKWLHFQRWGLPRRVEESIRQFMPNPPMYCQPEDNQPISLTLNNTSQDHVHRFGHSYMDSQLTQTFWVSEWPLIHPDQRIHCKQIPSLMGPSLINHKVLNGLSSLFERQTSDSENNFQKKFTQLFCGLPSLHSESLDATSQGSQGLSKNKNMSKATSKDPHLLKELSPAPPSSSTSPNGESLYEHQGTQISVPFLTPAERKALEWHILQRQPQLQWGLPDVISGSHHVQSHMYSETCQKAQSPKPVKASWPGRSFSVPTKNLVFFPEHTRRLLECHLQKQLMHLRWGLPQKIQRSIQLFLSSTDQQPLPCNNRALPNMSISQPEGLKANGFSPIVGKGSIAKPHLFSQAKSILKSHIDSKCGQIRQVKVPDCVQRSWECRIPGSPVPYIPPDKPLELQKESNPNLHHKVIPGIPKALDQEKQALPGAVIEHCKQPKSLSEETIKKLETILQHKYLAFLSGLSAFDCVVPSRVMSPEVPIQSEITETMPGPINSPQEPLTQTSLNRLRPHIQDDKKTSEDTVKEFPPERKVEGVTEKTPLKSQVLSASPYSNTYILAKLNFHLKKKVLEIKFGIPMKSRKFKKATAADPENKFKQESPGNLNNQGSTVLQKLPISQVSPAQDAKWVHLKKHLATEGQAVHHNPKQACSKSAPHGSSQRGSMIPQFSKDLTEAQVLCVQVETSGESPSLEEPFSTGAQSPDNSKCLSHVPTLIEKREVPRKPKAAGNLGEGDAGLGLSPTNGKRHHIGDQSPERKSLDRPLQGSWKQRPSFHLVDPCLHSPYHPPQLKFPSLPLGGPGGKESECDTQDSEAKVNVILRPARIPEITQPMVSQASQDHPLLGPPNQGRFLWGQTFRDQVLQAPVMPTSHKSSLPESGLRNKMKSFLHSINPKMKGKRYMEYKISTAGNVVKTNKNVEKGLAQAKSLTEKTKTEPSRGPKPQQFNAVGTAVLPCPTRQDNKLWLQCRQQGSASAPGYTHHCPLHCPRLA
uniref:Protein FAM205A n=1 Tax=Nannospalax galili TaxID=1026970 RepID=A0A8C6QZQ4_NANGA